MEVRKKIDKIIEYLLVFLLSTLVIDVIWQVVSRYLLSSPSKFTDELAGFLLMWVALLGAAYVTGKRQHLALSLLMSKINSDNVKKLKVIIHFSTIMFAFFVMIIGGLWLIYTRFYLGQMSAVLQIPIGYVYMVLPLSGVFIVYYSIDNAIEEWKTNLIH